MDLPNIGGLFSARCCSAPLSKRPAEVNAMSVQFVVNGRKVEVDPPARMTLADCLRQQVKLTGTHVGCEHGVCGACTVIVDGEAKDRATADSLRDALVKDKSYTLASTGADARGGRRLPYPFAYTIRTSDLAPKQAGAAEDDKSAAAKQGGGS
jgi:ferredoxin